MADELEDKIEKLLSKLEHVKNNIINLSNYASIEVSICYYGYKEQMWGWHIDSKTLRRLAEFNLSVDLDLYAGGPDLPSD